jgi:hypothetical protein
VVKNIDWEKEIPCDLVLNDISEEMTSNKPAVFLCTLTNLKNTHFELCKTPPPTPSSSHRCSLLVRKFCRLQKIRLIKTPIKIRLLKKNANASICISCLTFSQLTEPHIDSLKQKSWAEKE